MSSPPGPKGSPATTNDNLVHVTESKWPGGIDLGKENWADGLSSGEVEALRQRYGANETKTTQVPEWKKIAQRYLDWVSLLIVSRPAHRPAFQDETFLHAPPLGPLQLPCSEVLQPVLHARRRVPPASAGHPTWSKVRPP